MGNSKIGNINDLFLTNIAKADVMVPQTARSIVGINTPNMIKLLKTAGVSSIPDGTDIKKQNSSKNISRIISRIKQYMTFPKIIKLIGTGLERIPVKVPDSFSFTKILVITKIKVKKITIQISITKISKGILEPETKL